MSVDERAWARSTVSPDLWLHLVRRRQNAIASAERILEGAKGRHLTPSERYALDDLCEDAEAASRQLQALTASDGPERRSIGGES